MSKLEQADNDRKKVDVVKLKVDGVSNAVNTLKDQQTGGGVSLVCPASALEVSIPVRFGGSDAEGMTRKGVIHRIGVEDDSTTGLPRLRLSIRSDYTARSTMIASPSEGLLDEASRMTAAPEARTAVNLSQNGQFEEPDWDDLLAEDIDFEDDGLLIMDDESDENDPSQISCDPAWVGCGELPMPDQMNARSRTRKRRAVVAVAAWMMILGFATGGAYVLKEAGVINTEFAKAWLPGFIYSDSASVAESEKTVDEVEPVIEQPVALAISDIEPTAEDMPVLQAEMYEPEIAPAVTENQITPVADTRVADVVKDDVEIPAGDVALRGDEDLTASDKIQDENIDEVTVVLPTRWPVEYSTAYRLRDPNGVVVDVPGALVTKEGWLEVGKDSEMIRSVKAVQRETGARFVIFVNGELPRFMTAPKTGGVALRLYREQASDSAATQQVAVLDR